MRIRVSNKENFGRWTFQLCEKCIENRPVWFAVADIARDDHVFKEVAAAVTAETRKDRLSQWVIADDAESITVLCELMNCLSDAIKRLEELRLFFMKGVENVRNLQFRELNVALIERDSQQVSGTCFYFGKIAGLCASGVSVFYVAIKDRFCFFL